LIYKQWCSKIEEEDRPSIKIKLPLFHENCPILEVLVKNKPRWNQRVFGGSNVF